MHLHPAPFVSEFNLLRKKRSKEPFSNLDELSREDREARRASNLVNHLMLTSKTLISLLSKNGVITSFPNHALLWKISQ